MKDEENLSLQIKGGWNKEKVSIFKEEFYKFLDNCYINSKDHVGLICLGKNLFLGQRMLLEQIFDGLENDIHDFYILKSRQLGISTIVRALIVFWMGVHDGIKGATVFDTDGNKNSARKEIEQILTNLPNNFKFPSITDNNRYLIGLDNDSSLNFMSAGVRTSKSSGVLGRSVGLSLSHSSEMCSWENEEGVVSYRQSLSDVHPNRLFIWESTARGFNQWYEMWQEARSDTNHKCCVFLGWWSKHSQQISRSDPDFEKYGVQPPTEKERKKIKEVLELYGVDITAEQLAWYRRKVDPTAEEEGDAPVEYEGDVTQIQEQPWTEEEAFQQTGATFFQPETLTEISNQTVSRKFKTYSYSVGTEFRDCRIFPAHNARSVELKVWQEPEPDAVYVVSADVAFGHSEKNDRSAIQVLRCYADSLEQVAEYAWPLISSRQFAWVIASLLGWYSSMEASEIFLIVEINGPGEATWNELQSLKRELNSPYAPKDVGDKGLTRIFHNVRNYIYSRSDSMTPGSAWMWKTNQQLKVAIMERLRDFTTNKMLVIRSLDTVEEMKSITREGDSIEAEGSKKDDRIISLAMGVRCWEERARKKMMASRRTRANEEAKKRLTISDQVQIFNSNCLEQFFAVKAVQRRRARHMANKKNWRG